MSTLAREWQAVIANMTARPWIQHQLVAGDAVCARGAVMTCEGLIPGDEHILWQVAARQGLTEHWNDAGGRTKEQVVVWMRSVGVTDTDLEVTFGPQWRRVVALVRRAARLKPEEVEAVEAARAAAWDAAGAAAVSDLVGTHGLTQSHIDTLLASWIAIVGPDWERVG